ncbi:MAG: carboxyltransferase domain-containing protein [Pseudomonadota bacterium]
MSSGSQPVILPHGVAGAVVRFSDKLDDAANRAALAFRAEIVRAPPTGLEECASALASVFLRFDPGHTSFETLQADLTLRLATRDYRTAELPHKRRLWRVPAVFGGPHGPGLDAVAKAAGLTPEAAVEDLTHRPVRVLAIGFAPGMPYLGELAPRWDIPRLPDLIEVPEGALVLAIRQFVLFTNPSPTGWNHIAQTAFQPFRPNTADPFALRAGDEVWFRSVEPDEFRDLGVDGGAMVEDIP